MNLKIHVACLTGDTMNVNLDRLIRLRDVAPLVGMSKATIYRKIALGQFPRPVGVGSSSVRWRMSEVDSWMSALVSTNAR